MDLRSTKNSTKVVFVCKLLTADVFDDRVMDVVKKAHDSRLFPQLRLQSHEARVWG